MLHLDSLVIAYDAAPVLNNVSLRAQRGQITAIIGPNGCGKSTLLRCAAGLLKPQQGRVAWNEQDIFALDARQRARHIAFLPQISSAVNLTARDMVALGRTPHLGDFGTLGERDWQIVEQSLNRVGATDLAARAVDELSGGQRQRVLIARALAQQTPVLLLDEPISNLDLRYQFEILKLVRELAGASTCTEENANPCIIIVLHHINLASSVADAMLLLDEQGAIIAYGAPEIVMTGENLKRAFGVPLAIAPHPLSGRPQAQAMWSFENNDKNGIDAPSL